MAIVLTASVAATSFATRTNTTVTLGATPAVGAFIWSKLYIENNVTPTVPTGFTLWGSIDSPPTVADFWLAWKIAGASEPTAHTWTHASAPTLGTAQSLTSDSGGTLAIDSAALAVGNGSGTTATAATYTTSVDNAALLMWVSNWANATYSAWTSPLTERSDGTGEGMASGIQPTAGASGGKSATLSASDSWVTMMGAVIETAAAAPFFFPRRDAAFVHKRR